MSGRRWNQTRRRPGRIRMGIKSKFPRAIAIEVARDLCRYLEPHCERLIVAGSLRRRKMEVSDLELLFVPKFETVPTDLFAVEQRSRVDMKLEQLLAAGVLQKRLNSLGAVTWGPKNKYLVHAATGLPVDCFTTNVESWFNYLVCRTGSKESNQNIAREALVRGWMWNPYGPGFSRTEPVLNGGCREHIVTSEQEVFQFVGLPYREPWERDQP